jgi:methyltransferase (TIGR00027 family)
VRAMKLPEPSGLVFVPLDLARQTLVEDLRAADYRVELPGFFSWLDTTQYLPTDAVFVMLKDIASLAPGSEVVFTYHVSEDALEESDREVRRVLSVRAALGGAPWISSFDPSALAMRLEALGFTAVTDIGPAEAQARYFTGRTDDLVVPRLSRLTKARAGSASTR